MAKLKNTKENGKHVFEVTLPRKTEVSYTEAEIQENIDKYQKRINNILEIKAELEAKLAEMEAIQDLIK